MRRKTNVRLKKVEKRNRATKRRKISDDEGEHEEDKKKNKKKRRENNTEERYEGEDKRENETRQTPKSYDTTEDETEDKKDSQKRKKKKKKKISKTKHRYEGEDKSDNENETCQTQKKLHTNEDETEDEKDSPKKKKKKKNRNKGKSYLEGEHETLDSRQENDEQYDWRLTERRWSEDQDFSKESESQDAGTSKDTCTNGDADRNQCISKELSISGDTGTSKDTGLSGDADRYEERNSSGGDEALDKNQNVSQEEEENDGLDLDIGDIAWAIENWQENDDSSSSGIEDITAEVMGERGIFGQIFIANSQNDNLDTDVKEAWENRTTMTDGNYEPHNILSPDQIDM